VQGNIVIGHTTNEVGPENAQYLRRLSRKAADLNSDIQLEFVIDKKVQ
jgi:hypothetical protein